MFAASEVGKLLAGDGPRSALGPVASWPAALAMTVRLMLSSQSQMFLAWGPQRLLLYNDAYLPVLGCKHPAALLGPIWDCWGEVRAEAERNLELAFAGEAQAFRHYPIDVERNGRRERAWFDFTYTPIWLDDGSVGGVLCILREITRDVEVHDLLREEARQLGQLFDDAPGFMALLRGPAHVFALANQAYRELIGVDEPIGHALRELLPELGPQGFFELLDEVLATGEPYIGRRTPVRLRRQGATLQERFVDFIFQPVRDADGAVSGIFIQGSDVTDHVGLERRWRDAAAEMALERDRLNAVLDTAPAAISFADASGRLVGVNGAMNELWGPYPDTEDWRACAGWRGWWLDETGSPLRAIEAHEWPMARALRGEENVRELIAIEPFDRPGARLTVLTCGAPIRDAQGVVQGAIVAQIDMTEQARAEARVRESEARFKAIANAIPHLVWSNLPDGTHDFYNQRWYDFTGMHEGLVGDDQWKALVHPDDQAEAGRRWQHALDTGEAYETEFRLRHAPSGEYRWCLSRALPVRDAAGQVIRWMGSCTDVHDQKLQAEELRRANQRKDEFLAMLAHELRNPLAPVKAATDLLRLRTREGDAERLRAATEVIDRQVRHMTDLVDDLLDVSRVTRGLVELERRALDVRTVLANAVEQVRPLLEARGHKLHVHAGLGQAQVLGDHTRLVQVLVNLLGNAAKYTPQGGNIEIGVQASCDEIQIGVTDNGSGIEPALLPYVFDIFTQGVRTPDRSQGGLGIGLALVKSLVGLHGGQVSAHSEGAGKGSRFVVSLPLLARGAGAGPDGPSTGARPNRRRSVMVVDDNVDAADSMGALLEALGHQAHVVYDAHSALRDAERLRPDAFILDIGLPDIDGFELARRLRARPASEEALLVALTGYGQAHDRVLSRAAGFDHHFVKPIEIDDLETALAGGARALS
jgi:PAS domain S-box-containing protein